MRDSAGCASLLFANPAAWSHMMSRVFISFCLAALVLAGTSSAQTTAPVFTWPCPSKVEIHEKTLKRGHTGELHYHLVCSAGEKGQFVFRLQGLSFAKIDGQPVTEEMRQQLQAAVQAFDDMPGFVVDAQGRLVKLTDLERFMNSTAELTAKQGKAVPGNVLRDPRMAQVMQMVLADYWQSWVGHWTDFPAKPGAPVSDDVEQSFLPNTPPLSMHRTMEVLPVPLEASGTVHLRLKVELQGKQLIEFIKTLVPNQPDKAGQTLDDLPEMESFKIYEVKLDTQTRLPVWARREIRFRAVNEKDAVPFPPQTELHEYQFLWPEEK